MAALRSTCAPHHTAKSPSLTDFQSGAPPQKKTRQCSGRTTPSRTDFDSLSPSVASVTPPELSEDQDWREQLALERRVEAKVRFPTPEHRIRRQAIEQKIGLRVLSYADSCKATMSSYFCLNYREYQQSSKAKEFVDGIRKEFSQNGIGIRILGPTLEDFAAINSEINCSNFQTQTVSERLFAELQAAPSLDKIAQVIQRALIQAVHRAASVDYSFAPDCPGSTIVACSTQKITYRLTNPKILSFENMDSSLMASIARKIASISQILGNAQQVAELVDDSPVSHHLRSIHK